MEGLQPSHLHWADGSKGEQNKLLNCMKNHTFCFSIPLRAHQKSRPSHPSAPGSTCIAHHLYEGMLTQNPESPHDPGSQKNHSTTPWWE